MLIPAKNWRSAAFDPPLSDYMFRALVREGRIVPAPQKLGAIWYVDQEATVVPASQDPVVDRIAAEVAP